MFSILNLSLMAFLLRSANGQDNGQYTPWTPSTTDYWTTTTPEYWTPTTTYDDWTTVTTPYADWTSYTTVTSCYVQNGVTITITTWVPCPCEDGQTTFTTYPDGIITPTNGDSITTETLVTTTTPAYSTWTSNGIVYVVPVSTPVTATESAGVEIVNASDAIKSTEVEGWIGILSAVVLGGFAVVAVVL